MPLPLPLPLPRGRRRDKGHGRGGDPSGHLTAITPTSTPSLVGGPAVNTPPSRRILGLRRMLGGREQPQTLPPRAPGDRPRARKIGVE